MITRTTFLRSDYYLQFANNGIRASVAILFSPEELKTSTDRYFNDIDRSRWLNCARYIYPWLNFDLLKEAGECYSEIFAVTLCKVVAQSLIQNS
jgi:hypothetical protein